MHEARGNAGRKVGRISWLPERGSWGSMALRNTVFETIETIKVFSYSYLGVDRQSC
jgi:hypothetical protein